MNPATEQTPIPYEARIAGWLAVPFFVDVSLLGRVEGASLMDTLLINGVLEANLAPLNRDPDLQVAYATLGNAPPDELRRPVSINALAGSLRLPFETVRRRVNKLVREGKLAAASQGVYVTAATVTSPTFIGAVRARYERVLRFYDELCEAGVIEPLPAPLPSVDHPAAPARAVGRVLSDYVFRTLDPLLERVGDPLTGIIMLEIARSSTEHLSVAQAIGFMRDGWIPDSERVPARVAELSRKLDIPYETTRRHVGWLVDQQICGRFGGGVLLTAAYRARGSLPAVTGDNLVNVRRMFRLIAALRDADAAAVQAARP